MSTGTRIEVNKLMNKPVECKTSNIFSNVFFHLTKYGNCGGSMSSLVRPVRSVPNNVQNTEYQGEDCDHLGRKQDIFFKKKEWNHLQQRVSIRVRLHCGVTIEIYSELHCSLSICPPCCSHFENICFELHLKTWTAEMLWFDDWYALPVLGPLTWQA